MSGNRVWLFCCGLNWNLESWSWVVSEKQGKFKCVFQKGFCDHVETILITRYSGQHCQVCVSVQTYFLRRLWSLFLLQNLFLYSCFDECHSYKKDMTTLWRISISIAWGACTGCETGLCQVCTFVQDFLRSIIQRIIVEWGLLTNLLCF